MQKIDLTKLPLVIGAEFREYFVDGVVWTADLGDQIVVTFANGRPAIKSGVNSPVAYELAIVCRLIMPSQTAKMLLDVVSRHIAKMEGGAGHA